MLLQIVACLAVVFASLHAIFRMIAHHAVLLLMIGCCVASGCGLTNVQKVRLACAESAEGLASAYRITAQIESAKRGEVLQGIAAADAARGALCTETLYSAVESGTADVPRLVAQIVALTASVTLAVAPYIGGK